MPRFVFKKVESVEKWVTEQTRTMIVTNIFVCFR